MREGGDDARCHRNGTMRSVDYTLKWFFITNTTTMGNKIYMNKTYWATPPPPSPPAHHMIGSSAVELWICPTG